MDAVLYERDGDVGVLTLNRPDNRNSMTEEILEGVAARAQEARDDAAIRCLVLTGRGRCFSAGADFKSQIQRDAAGRTPHERSYAMYAPFLSLLDVEVPIVGAINGHAVGGGFGLSLMCDLRYVREDAKYGANFTRLGLHPGMAVSYLLPRLVGLPQASEWLYTGRLFDGHEGARAGLFNAALQGGEVLGRAMETARAIAANAPIAMRMTKRSLREGLGWDIRGAAHREAFAQAVSVDTEDAKEGMAALLEKRDPDFKGR
ncbi:MAG: enoyl-CoA hydratase/isomerase family protein [Sandaracinaceae bacterium]